MLLITCPHCGPRAITEFGCHGEAHIVRPKAGQDSSLTDEAWGDYVFYRDNPKGLLREQWSHDAGCTQWFYAIRNSVTDIIFATYLPTDPPPPLPDPEPESHPYPALPTK